MPVCGREQHSENVKPRILIRQIVYFALVFALSVPFWAVGSMQEDWLPRGITINLPMSALMFVCPALAASMLVFRAEGWGGVKRLWTRGVDYRIRPKIWYLPVVFLMPLLMLVEYGVLQLLGVAIPNFQIIVWAVPVFTAIFLITGICEEIGWSGYATDPLQERWGALVAGIVIGAVWGIWHGIPYLQAHHSSQWVFWQCVSTVGNRVLIIWLYNNTGKSIFAASVFHAMYNVSFLVLFPVYGSYHRPLITAVLNTVLVAVVVFLWGARTLSRLRYAGDMRGWSHG